MFYNNHTNIYDYVKSDIPDGDHTFMTGEQYNIQIDVEFINVYDQKTYTASTSLGSSRADTRMLIVKYHKGLIIESGVRITSAARKKGMVIFVKGKLTNKGIISMTARGANAVGQNVYLYNNKKEKKFEIVPAVGASGGSSFRQPSGSTGAARPGASGTNRRTGGGGSGVANYGTAGAGAAGTSYSGGGGGGGAGYDGKVGGSASPNGGAGGAGSASRTKASGGAGNPGGGPAARKGEDGTGGLLIIYADTFDSTGTLESRGSNGHTGFPRGGGSGGGSVNVFASNFLSKGSTSVAGGNSAGSGTSTFTVMNNIKFLIRHNGDIFTIDENKRLLRVELPSEGLEEFFDKKAIDDISRSIRKIDFSLSENIKIQNIKNIKKIEVM